MKKFLGFLLSLAFALGVHAQTAPALTFTAATVTGNGTVTPVLSWAAVPAGATCTASGAWTGTKAATGTETLAAINKTATYNLSCTWPGSGDSVTLSWTPPTQNVDDTPLADLAGFKVYEGSSATALNKVSADYANPAKTTGTLGPYQPGTVFFALSAYNSRGVESVMSNVVSKTFTANAAVTKSVGITVNPQPKPPTNVTAQ